MTGKTTRQTQADFEQCLKHALLNKDVIREISEILIGSIIEKLSEKFTYYDNKISTLESEISELKSCIEHQAKTPDGGTQKHLQERVDIIHQETKRNNIRIIGMKEERGEKLPENTIKLFQEKLNCDIEPLDIISVYRTGAEKNNRPRHVVIKFKDNATKMKIYNNKKLFKGTGIVVKEDLIPSRLLLVQKESEKFGYRNVWTINGKVFVKTSSGVKKI